MSFWNVKLLNKQQIRRCLVSPSQWLRPRPTCPVGRSTSPGRAETGGRGLGGPGGSHHSVSPAEGLPAVLVAPEPLVPRQPQPRALACPQGGSPPPTGWLGLAQPVLGSCPVHPLDVSSTPCSPQLARTPDVSPGCAETPVTDAVAFLALYSLPEVYSRCDLPADNKTHRGLVNATPQNSRREAGRKPGDR